MPPDTSLVLSLVLRFCSLRPPLRVGRPMRRMRVATRKKNSSRCSVRTPPSPKKRSPANNWQFTDRVPRLPTLRNCCPTRNLPRGLGSRLKLFQAMPPTKLCGKPPRRCRETFWLARSTPLVSGATSTPSIHYPRAWTTTIQRWRRQRPSR
jgi:hypothetical protein